MSSRGRGRSLWFKAVSHHEALEARADRIMKNFAAYRRAKILRPPAKLLLSLPSPCPFCQALVHLAKPLLLMPSPQGSYPISTACAGPGRRDGLLCPLSAQLDRASQVLLHPPGSFVRQVLVPLAGPPGPWQIPEKAVSDPSHTCIPHEKNAEDRQSIDRQVGCRWV